MIRLEKFLSKVSTLLTMMRSKKSTLWQRQRILWIYIYMKRRILSCQLHIRLCGILILFLEKMSMTIRKTWTQHLLPKRQKKIPTAECTRTISLTKNELTRTVVDCYRSNYSSRVIFSYTFTLEPNMNWIGWTVSEIWPFEIIFQNARSVSRWPSVGRRSSIYIHCSHVLLFGTLGM